ncbi:hypothetical protein Poli38472_005278 [Pythium oligandrum]|uniref:ACB domain-containing protein n=1 Tax=Pythium oligandrum TaxID=41045 RepID=A0A8K1CH76_PYTOL|nr:hypothetical protein Poli38472_005278 [Pythium oligandrum]|eukprot:TMW62660.1 hypothetical protein Poli38472_005278 [Pythium oligandrum]
MRRREEESSLLGYEHAFQRAADALRVAAQQKEVYVSDPQKIKLYALFKQATEGDCAKPQPSAFQPVERAKWNGWQALQGMDMIVAKRRYVLQVIELMPSFKMPTEPVATEPSVDQPQRTAPGGSSRPQPAPRRRREPRGPRVAPVPATQQRKIQAPTASYAWIVGQLGLLTLCAGVLAVAIGHGALPLCDRVAVEYFDMENCQPLKAFAPLMWFSGGYLLVFALRSKMFSWRLLSGEFIWLSVSAPVRRLRRLRRRRAAPREDSERIRTKKMLQELGIHLVTEPEGNQDRWATPRVELTLPSDPDGLSFGHATLELPFTLEQTANVYYRKFKEPLPDPANHLLVALETEEEKVLEQWDAVYRRRILRFRNATPYLIKRFVNSEFIEYVEYSLLDKRNRVFYVYIKNRSFDSIGAIEDYSIYHATDGKPEWTTLTQSARVHITSSSVGFFRSQIESFISTFYAKQAPIARQYHLQRLAEEFGSPEST